MSISRQAPAYVRACSNHNASCCGVCGGICRVIDHRYFCNDGMQRGCAGSGGVGVGVGAGGGGVGWGCGVGGWCGGARVKSV